MKIKLLQALVLSSTLFLSAKLAAEQVVIVHPSNSSSLSKTDVKRLYLAKVKKFSNGDLAIPLNHKEGSDSRASFDEKIVGKDPAQMKAYWAKLVFTGAATPLKELNSDEEIVELVSKNPSTIGYINSANATDSVKVVVKF